MGKYLALSMFFNLLFIAVLTETIVKNYDLKQAYAIKINEIESLNKELDSIKDDLKIARQTDNDLYQRAQNQSKNGEYRFSNLSIEDLIKRFPFSSLIKDATALYKKNKIKQSKNECDLINAELKEGNLDECLIAINEFQKKYPNSPYINNVIEIKKQCQKIIDKKKRDEERNRLPNCFDIKLKSPVEIQKILGKPSTKEKTEYGTKYSYRNGLIEILFINNKADWITITPQNPVRFSARAIEHIGFTSIPTPTFENENVIRFSNIKGFREVSVFPGTGTSIYYFYIKCLTR